MKKKWSEIIKIVVNAVKVALFIVVMIMGFLTIYGMIWLGVGLPYADWAMWILCLLSLISTRLFLWWL